MRCKRPSLPESQCPGRWRGKGDLLKAQVCGVSSVERHQDGVPFVIPLEHFHVRVGIVVAGETDEADLSGLLGGLECFNGASGSENLLDILMVLHSMHLPEINIVSLQGSEGRSQIFLGSLSGALGALRCDEDVFPKLRQDVPVGFLGMSIPVSARAIEVVDT